MMNDLEYAEDFDKYKNRMEAPVLLNSAPKRPNQMRATSKDYISYGEKLKIWEDKRDEHKKRMVEYRNETTRLEELFKSDALKLLELADHPNADAIYRFAWNNGHSGELQDVYYWLKEIAELIKVEGE